MARVPRRGAGGKFVADPVRVAIKGIQEAQSANLKVIAALKPESAFGRAIQFATTAAHRYAVALTHVDTGALRASQRMELDDNSLRGRVFLDASARNPLSGARTVEYGPFEHVRGGEHAFYRRVVDEYGARIASEAGRMILQGMP